MIQQKKSTLAVFGIFDSRVGIDHAVDKLKMAGFSNLDISVLMPTQKGNDHFVHEKSSKAPEGATTGATSGALLGGGLGWLVGIGALAIPGIGPFVAAGPIMAALAGAGVGGAVGGVAGGRTDQGLLGRPARRVRMEAGDRHRGQHAVAPGDALCDAGVEGRRSERGRLCDLIDAHRQ